MVVPFSATAPHDLTPAHVEFQLGSYPSLTEHCWALCDCIRTLSHARLERVFVGGVYLSEMISEHDMARVDIGIRHATGLA